MTENLPQETTGFITGLLVMALAAVVGILVRRIFTRSDDTRTTIQDYKTFRKSHREWMIKVNDFIEDSNRKLIIFDVFIGKDGIYTKELKDLNEKLTTLSDKVSAAFKIIDKKVNGKPYNGGK